MKMILFLSAEPESLFLFFNFYGRIRVPWLSNVVYISSVFKMWKHAYEGIVMVTLGSICLIKKIQN